jgi:hypothetical protein
MAMGTIEPKTADMTRNDKGEEGLLKAIRTAKAQNAMKKAFRAIDIASAILFCFPPKISPL